MINLWLTLVAALGVAFLVMMASAPSVIIAMVADRSVCRHVGTDRGLRPITYAFVGGALVFVADLTVLYNIT